MADVAEGFVGGNRLGVQFVKPLSPFSYWAGALSGPALRRFAPRRATHSCAFAARYPARAAILTLQIGHNSGRTPKPTRRHDPSSNPHRAR